MPKKKHPEHENLERWLVSYADFMTLLFATFVVLYGLAQTNVTEFKKIEESLKKAFSVQSILDGGSGVFSSGEKIIAESSGDTMIDTLMMEYLSPRYEQQSYEQIKKEIDDKVKTGDLKDVKVQVDDRGLVVTITDKNVIFPSASAELTPEAKRVLDEVGKLIVEKFALHVIRIEGHTDSLPMKSDKYPSNWELSSARASSIVRYLIDKFKVMPDLMSAVGYADTRPIDSGKDSAAMAKNRRVEIVVLKNQFKGLDHYQNSFMKLDKTAQQLKRNEQIKIIKELDNKEIENLEDDVINTSDMQNSKSSKYESNTSDEFLKESKRIESLSKKSAKD